MESVDPYRRLAEQVSESEFARRHPYFFLLGRGPVAGAAAGAGAVIAYQTAQTARASTSKDEPIRPEELKTPGAVRAALVRKRPENPFPERITVGRAPNCDIVFRVTYVSKLHATFTKQDDTLCLADHQSANGTKVNGHALTPGTPAPVQSGDIISLGGLHLELVDAARFHRLLRGTLSRG